MKENKNIERLFQEKFKDFEATPPEAAWNNIASRLQEKKKKRRVIPFWFKASGIAASLILGFFLYQNFQQNGILKTTKNPVVIEENNLNNKANENNTINPQKIESNEVVVETSKEVKNLEESTENKSALNENIKKGDVIVNSSVNKAKNSNDPIIKANTLNKESIGIKKSNQSEVVVSSSSTGKNLVNPKLNEIANKKPTKEELVLSNKTEASIVDQNNITKPYQKTTNQNEIIVNKANVMDKEVVVLNIITNDKVSPQNLDVSKEEVNKKNNEGVVVAENTSKTNSSNIDKTTIVEAKTITEEGAINKSNLITKEKGINFPNSITKEAKEQNAITEIDKNQYKYSKSITNGLLKDSANVITEVEPEVNALEQLLKEKEEGRNADEKEKEKRSKWAVSSNAAPVYFNSISQGSPIDDQFAENAKSYATSLSYGLGLEYSLTKKLSIRSGINSIAVNYDTNEVYYTNSLARVNSETMNVSRNQNAENLVLNNRRSTLVESLSFDVENFTTENVASLNQKMGYVEVPLELSYKIIDNKFGINFIGGMSTLFLNKNEIALVSNGSEMVIGEANNLNSIHFSSNVGLGFKYSFWKSFNANFQPMFKYQINTFNEDSGNFKPFIIGLYSGISFNF